MKWKIWLGILTACIAFMLVMNQFWPFKAKQGASSMFLDVAVPEPPNEGKHVLFIRKSPVITAAIGFDSEDREWIAETVGLYSKASELSVSFSGHNANLIIVRTNDTHSGDYLNPAALLKYGIKAEHIAMMNESPIWTFGCGIYNFRGGDGRIAGSIGVVDTELVQDKQKDCASFAILLAFGLGMSIQPGTSLPRLTNVFKNAFILNTAMKCEMDNLESAVESTRSCIDDKIIIKDILP